MRSLDSKGVIRYVCTGVLIIIIGFLGFITSRSLDDYWYAAFLTKGIKNFVKLTFTHYQEFNGRAFVHILAQIALGGGNWLIGISHILIFSAIAFFGIKGSRRQLLTEREDIVIGMAFFGAGILSVPRWMQIEGIMWTSAFFSFVFPVLMLVGLVNILHKYEDEKQGIRNIIILVIYSFLCGATTEQTGSVSVAMALLFCIDCFFRKGSLNKYAALSFISCIAGLATIFLSPATRKRVGWGVVSDKISEWILKYLEVQSGFYIEDLRVFTALLLFFLIFGVYFAILKGCKKYFLLGAGAAAVAVVTCLVFRETAALCVIYLFIFIIASVLIFLTDRREIGYYVMAGLASSIVVLPTDTNQARTLLPFCIYILLASVIMLTYILKAYPRHNTIAIIVVTIISVSGVAPTFDKHIHNYKTDIKNFQFGKEAKTTGILYILLDYHTEYSLPKMYDDNYTYSKYLEWMDLDAQAIEIVYITTLDRNIYIDGELTRNFPYIYDDDIYYLPMRYIIEHYGGEVGYTNQVTTAALGDKYFELRGDNASYIDSNGNIQYFEMTGILKYARTYLPLYFYEQYLGMDITVDEAKNSIFVEYPSF